MDFESSGCAFEPRRGRLGEMSRVLLLSRIAEEHALCTSAGKVETGAAYVKL